MSSTIIPTATTTQRWAPNLIELSRPISLESGYAVWGLELDKYPFLRDIEVEYPSHFPEDNGTVCRFTIGDHTSTHVDAPIHTVEGGPELQDVDISHLVGEAVVLDMHRGHVDYIYTAEDFEAAKGAELVEPGDIVLIYSGYKDATRTEKMLQTAVGIEGAEWLVDHGVKAVGCEPIGIEHLYEGYYVHNYYGKGHPNAWPVHRIFLSRNIYIIEGLTNLERIKGQRVRFAALPLLFPHLSGSPVRAVAWIE